MATAMNNEDDRRVTTGELAKRWGVKPQLLREMQKAGEGPSYNETLKGYMLSSIIEFEGGGLFSKKQLAARWGIGIRALEKREASGRTPDRVKVGRTPRYRLNDIVAFEKQTSSK